MLTSSEVVEHRVDDDTLRAVEQREHDRNPCVAILHARNHVRALVAEEDRHEHLEHASRRGDRAGTHCELHALGSERHIALGVRIRHAPREVREQLVERRQHASVEGVAARDRLLVAARLGIGLGQHVFDVRVHTHGREHAPRDRAEERLGDLAVVAVDDEGAVQPLYLLPGRHIRGERAELVAHVFERLQQVRAVEREPRGRVVLGADPVASLETIAHAARDRGEARDERRRTRSRSPAPRVR